jgi:hypothetical protein
MWSIWYPPSPAETCSPVPNEETTANMNFTHAEISNIAAKILSAILVRVVTKQAA